MASYPGAAKSFTVRNDGDDIEASHVNDLQDETAAIETGLLSGFQHLLKPLATATFDLGTTLAQWRDLYLSRNATIGGTLSVTGATTLSGLVTNAAQVRCSVYHNAAQSLSDGVGTALIFNTENFDVGGLHDTSANTSRITIPVGGDGLYLLVGQVSFDANATGIRSAYFKKNGTQFSYNQVPGSASNPVILSPSRLVSLVAGDYVELFGVQNSGGSLNTGSTSANLGNVFEAVKLW